MLFELTGDQELLRDTSQRFVDNEMPSSRVRELHDDPVGTDRQVLRDAAELGWFSMLVPESLGGGSVSGAGLVDAAVIAELLGRHVQPGPFVPMNIVARAVARTGSTRTQEQVLSRVLTGEIAATIAACGAEGSFDGGAGVQVRVENDVLVLDGTRWFVQDAVLADQILVHGTVDGTPVHVLVPTSTEGVEVRPLVSLDLSRRFAHVELRGAQVPADGMLSADPEEIDDQLDIGVALTLAETIGAMDALFEMTVDYAKDRVAFGRPIGSFQALKHLLADQALYLETSKAAVSAAISALAAGDHDASGLVSMAAAYVFDQGNELAQVCLQIHGGIGFTWEHDLHLYLRRIRSNSALFGEATWHRERVCALAGIGEDS